MMMDIENMKRARQEAQMRHRSMKEMISDMMHMMPESSQMYAKVAFAMDDIESALTAICGAMSKHEDDIDFRRECMEYLEMVKAGIKTFCDAHGIEVTEDA